MASTTGEGRGLGPALGGDHAVLDVHGDHDPRAVLGDDVVEEVDVAEGRGADDGALGAGAQGVPHGVDGPQAAAVLDRDAGLGHDPAEVLQRLRGPRARAVEVDDEQVPRTRLDPRAGRVEQVRVVRRRVLELAFDQPDGLAFHDVDRRVEDHATGTAARAAKFLSICKPSVEDFSGWNWAAMTLSRSTTLTNRSPYSPVPTTSDASAGRQAKECTW